IASGFWPVLIVPRTFSVLISNIVTSLLVPLLVKPLPKSAAMAMPWTREIDGRVLTFHLAGINNQNFLMRDEETGSFWQQISGAAVSGPLKGRQLTLVHTDELTLATWKSEQPRGTVLDDVPKYRSDYAKRDWD